MLTQCATGTITCSRDAVKPAEFYFFSSEAADAKAMLDNAGYLLKEMANHYNHLQPTRANGFSNTIYFKKPGEGVVNRYFLATMGLDVHGQRTPFAHIVVMPHVSKKILDEFLTDLGKN